MARASTASTSEYELKRQEKIAKNQALLRNLALDAASAGIAPSAKKAQPSGAPKKKPAPKKIKEEDVGPRRTSSRLRGIVADSEVAKRKAEDEHDAFREAERAKRQRVSGDLNLGDVLVNGQDWNLISDLRTARPYERTFDAQKMETSDKELKALRETMSNLALWEDFTPNEIKITPERIYAMGFHPTTDKPLVFAGDKLGNLGLCDCSPQSAAAVKQEDEDEDSDPLTPAITTLKIHTRTISAFQFSPTDAHNLYSASYDSTIRRTDLHKGVALEIYAPADPTIDAPLSGVQIHPSTPHLVSFTTLNGTFGQHDTRTKPSNTTLYQLSDKKIGGFSLHPTLPHLLATASLDRTLKLWDLRYLTVPNDDDDDDTLPDPLGEHTSRLSVSHAAFGPAGHVATSSYDDTVKIYDFSNAEKWTAGEALSEDAMKPAAVVPHNNQTGRWVTILRPQWQLHPPDGIQRFAIGNMNRFVDVYTAKGEQVGQLGDGGMDEQRITAVPAVGVFHPSRNWVAGGTASGKLCLWM